MNLQWAQLVEGYAAQLYTLNGGCWPWSMVNDGVKRRWKAVAKHRLRTGRSSFAGRPVTPRNFPQMRDGR